MLQQTTFIKSAAAWKDLPPEGGKEIAFAGRSNSGKSSTLNVLCTQRKLARTSRTPGRTTLLNFFQVEENRWLVDLPGYGFARASAKLQETWTEFVSRYLSTRNSLNGVVLIMDIRHPLTPLDRQVLEWLVPLNIPIHILLNKADKLGYGAQQKTFFQVKTELEKMSDSIGLQTFSAHTRLNLDVLQNVVENWLDIAKCHPR
jgi:GTP-binding protein